VTTTSSPQSAVQAIHAYWEARAERFAHRGWGLRAVCSYGMPAFYNGYVHLVQRRALAPWLRVAPGMRALDVGCGVGRWTRRLARGGADVVGIDHAAAMIAEARRRTEGDDRAARCRYQVADIADLQIDGRFDRILCVTVLQHILEPARLERAVRRLAAHLADGGRMVVLEVAPSASTTRCNAAAFVARTEADYQQLFTTAGLRCVATCGVDPLPLKTWLLPRYALWPKAIGTCALFAATALALPFDLATSRWLPQSSWHRVFVLAKHDESPAAGDRQS
jgi:2-polyprenyl-3-methyl-5-hydroxy-6-metoxy-1,4-benzoquinol methylase